MTSGIFGGYDGGDVAARDGSFSIDCHSDAVREDQWEHGISSRDHSAHL